MRVLPILFNTEMVRAILDGRKTTTRRIVNPQPRANTQTPLGYVLDSTERKRIGCYGWGINEYGGSISYAKPKYQPGDILYVRETFCLNYFDKSISENTTAYKADYRKDIVVDVVPEPKWRPSIHMPKEAARIWLKVTDVHVERLQDITEEQVESEGFEFKPHCLSMVSADGHYCDLDGPCTSSIKYCDMSSGELFGKVLWNSTVDKKLIDQYGWEANPWVWVIEFERCEKPKE